MTTNDATDAEAMAPAWVSIRELTLTAPLRPVDPAHVARLIDVLDRCGPLLVHRDTGRVLDGHHRAAAASALDRSAVQVQWVDGDEAELLEIALQANSAHGLPLTHAQRREGVDKLLDLRPGWSNRRIAEAVGVGEATVRRHRALTATSPTCPASSATHLDGRRQGQDGKTYPGRPVDLADLLRANPQSSNRAIARLAGCSPSTVAARRRHLRLALDVPSASSEAPHGWVHTLRMLLALVRSLRTWCRAALLGGASKQDGGGSSS